MNRRNFLKGMAPLVTLPIVMNGMNINVFAKSNLLHKLAETLSASDRVLVIVQMQGGNDGINTVLPLDQYSALMNARSNIAIPEASALKLNAKTGLHPAMTGLKGLYDDAKLAVIQGVSYPTPNLSHFRATDIWMSGSDYNQYLRTGWAGRYLDYEFPNYPQADANMPDPLAIQIGAVMATALQGDGQSMGIAIQDPNTFYQLVNGTTNGTFDPPEAGKYGDKVKFLRQVQVESLNYSKQIKAAADKASNITTYPTSNNLADQLKIVARLIAGGLKTRIYIVNIGGFDTHSAQVLSTDTTKGNHATLLGKLSDAISSFQTDLKQLNIEEKVIGMTFSEFGRRVASNGSLGTDHGTSIPMFVFGKNVNAGIYGNNPSLTDLDNGNLKRQFDFRQIYASILSQWFTVSDSELTSVMLKAYTQVPIINSKPNSVDSDNQSVSAEVLGRCYPNPATDITNISLNIQNSGNYSINLFDINGRLIYTIPNRYLEPGSYIYPINLSTFQSGEYIIKLDGGRISDYQRLIIAK